MFELIAQGPGADNRWRVEIKTNHPMELGREAHPLKADWDSQISRRHAIITLTEEDLLVERLAAARNPVFFGGTERDSFRLKPGEHFVIGSTTFMLTNEVALPTLDVPNPVTQRSYTAEFLRSNVEYVDSDRRIKVLNRLPDLISNSGSERELYTRFVNTLMEGIVSATSVAIFRQSDHPDGSRAATEVIHWDRRRLTSGDFSPSERLISQAIKEGQVVEHIWNQTRAGGPEYTMDMDNDWAFVCPLTGTATHGWGIYVTGKNRVSAIAGSDSASSSGELDLQGDIKFCELIGSTLQNLLEAQRLERRQSSLRSFFSPVVLEAFSDHDPEDVLTPKECEVSVLFCDLRGFSKASEQMAGDLLELLSRVSNSLGIMTHSILEHGGVIGDFHGDAAMGFWGWPLDQSDRAIRAIDASMQIKKEFARINSDPDHPLKDFQMGVGIATGPAVAGKIGTSDQVKVTAFGPVVNLASRLEGMTKWFGGSILLDEETVTQVRDQPHHFTLQRLGSFLPFGLRTPSVVHRVVPVDLTDPTILEKYDDALVKFESGRWSEAGETLAGLGDEPCSQFLLQYIRSHADCKPPMGFSGVIELSSK
ncbi:adenylate/guanylate cyclase domain-containing protein [Mariniblastus fucicola]|nr:adenylate/guanylate cyclase domain-containing protein [Mariniblastus fucicola]